MRSAGRALSYTATSSSPPTKGPLAGVSSSPEERHARLGGLDACVRGALLLDAVQVRHDPRAVVDADEVIPAIRDGHGRPRAATHSVDPALHRDVTVMVITPKVWRPAASLLPSLLRMWRNNVSAWPGRNQASNVQGCSPEKSMGLEDWNAPWPLSKIERSLSPVSAPDSPTPMPPLGATTSALHQYTGLDAGSGIERRTKKASHHVRRRNTRRPLRRRSRRFDTRAAPRARARRTCCCRGSPNAAATSCGAS